MKRVYVETTVVSYYVARPSRDIIVAGRQESTRELWPKLTSQFEGCISFLVRDEVAQGEKVQASLRLDAIQPFAVLQLDQSAAELAAKIISGFGIPAEYPEDALHIAIAAVNGVDILITWNFAHMNNPFSRSKVREIVEAAGHMCPEICSPDELLEGEA